MGSLDDLAVLDLTRVLGGPYCTMLLADMGANVLKVEPPGGDWVRRTPPFHHDDESEAYGGYFQSVNRGKLSLELDLTDEDDREDFLSLVDRADVLVENYRAGTMERFDLSYETLHERNPGLVYAAIRGFGDPRTGATSQQQRPAYDLIVQAMAGVMQINGQPDDPPTKFGIGIGDLFTGALSAVGILSALHHRERTGEGQFVDTSMYDAMVSMCERTVYQYSMTGEVPGRNGNSHPILFPYDAFPASDGQVVIAAIGPSQWDNLVEAIGRPELTAFREQSVRLENREWLRETISDWTSERTVEEVLDVLETVVPTAPVRTVADVFADGIADSREMLVELGIPGTDNQVTVAGSPIKMTATPTGPTGPAPLLDQHRGDLLDGDDDSWPETTELLDEAANGRVPTRTDGSGDGDPEE
ncbi:CoA transferase [Halobaculum limi]|uniref:CoA transferase n=1 Tax=Halobaculum limi TaxID=3031916 RepID=UPI002405DC0F|nr:CoA transferase [Halobaculum sp. YSMS11]